MFRIVGIGKVGCSIATHFDKLPQYDVTLLDEEVLGTYSNMEECEKKVNTKKFSAIARRFRKDEEVLIITQGSDSLNGCLLLLGQKISKCKVSLLHIYPDLSLSTPTEKTNNKITFGVLQEMTRSGLFERFYIASIEEIEKHLDNVSLSEIDQKIGELVFGMFSMLIYFDHTTPARSNYEQSKEAVRLCTIGYFDEQNNEHSLFPLENIKEKIYYYGIPEEEFNTERLKQIKQHQIALNQRENNSFFKAYVLSGDETHRYFVHLTDIPQISD